MREAAAILCALLLAATLASCGSEPEGRGPNPGDGSGAQAPSEEIPAPSRPETTVAAPATTPEPTTTEKTGGATAGGEPGRIYEEAGGFSWVPPEGWDTAELPGMKFRAASGPPSDGFAPNINVVDEPYPGPLDAYAAANLRALRTTFEGFRLISREDFPTEAGDSGIRMATESVQQNTRLRQTFYLFDAGDAKLVVTCSRLADGQQEVDAACDESMKTFRIE